MKNQICDDTLSRIDKFLMDSEGLAIDSARAQRMDRELQILVGEDVKRSYGLQVALLTAVNLGVKCFGGKVTVYGSPLAFNSPCEVPLANSKSMGDAVVTLGARLVSDGIRPEGRHLLLGNATAREGAIRLTYDGWSIAVGPIAELPQLSERDFFPGAGIAAAAIAVEEVFAESLRISITAARRVIKLSLWRPDLPFDHPDSVGKPLTDLPRSLGIFGLGHLGQAYVWAVAALPYNKPEDITLLLCDDDHVVPANIETGALLAVGDASQLKTRVVSSWLENRGFSTRLLERRVDANFKRNEEEPEIALSGFDDNRPRQWLSNANFAYVFDSGLGGEASNFDAISFHIWPNQRAADEIWPIETMEETLRRDNRKKQLATRNSAYINLGEDECGRLQLASKSVAVPFVGAMASSIVLAELLKTLNSGPVFSDQKLRLCSIDTNQHFAQLVSEAAPPLRGVATTCISSATEVADV